MKPSCTSVHNKDMSKIRGFHGNYWKKVIFLLSN